MEISKEKVLEIAKRHNLTIMDSTDAHHAFGFVWEIICAEYDFIKEHEPYATKTLNRLETAEHEVFDLWDGVYEAMAEAEEVEDK